MLKYIVRRTLYGILVLIGVVILVFFLFQGIGDPSRLVMGQSGDSATQAGIRKELYLDQPKWKQFVLYLNDVSPLCVHDKEDIQQKDLRGFFIGGDTKFGIKLPYLRRSYQSKREVGTILMEALPGTLLLALAAMIIVIYFGVVRSHRVLGMTLLVILTVLVIWTAPNRWGVGIALHYLSRVYWPDPADPVPPLPTGGP